MKRKKGTVPKIIAFAIAFIICATGVSVAFTIFDFQDSKKSIEYTQKWLNYKYELESYITKQQLKEKGYNGALLYADAKSLQYARKKVTTENIKTVIPSMLNSDMRDFVIERGKLKYIGTDEKMREAAKH